MFPKGKKSYMLIKNRLKIVLALCENRSSILFDRHRGKNFDIIQK